LSTSYKNKWPKFDNKSFWVYNTYIDS
jgi:hypothetical protein